MRLTELEPQFLKITRFGDISLVAGSSSVQLIGGCNWHGYVQGGEVRDA